jgi:hypothetical protein
MLFEVELILCWIYYSSSFLAIAKMISIIIMVINLMNMFGIINYLMTGYSGNNKFIVPWGTCYYPHTQSISI